MCLVHRVPGFVRSIAAFGTYDPEGSATVPDRLVVGALWPHAAVAKRGNASKANFIIGPSVTRRSVPNFVTTRQTVLEAGLALQKAGVIKPDIDVKAATAALIDTQYAAS